MNSSEIKWTPEQEKAVTNRGSGILVSAAAGSGKTAVLVDRILSKVFDDENPIDIDRFLVVTFTKAAAAQMKEKLASKIEKKLLDNPDNENLMKQMLLVNRADIITIDSFCNKIVKEYFSVLDIDSNINIGDEGIMNLIKSDVLDSYFEDMYQNNYDSFADLLDVFSNNGDDSELKNLILKIYRLASGFPQPDKWINDAKKALSITEESEVSNLPWVNELFNTVISNVKDILNQAQIAMEICETPGGPDKCIATSESDIKQIEAVLNANNMKELADALSSISFARMAICKGEMYDAELKEQYKEARNSYKTAIKELENIVMAPEEIVEQTKHISIYLLPVLEMVEKFTKLYYEEKMKRKLMEFSDISHLAYKLVCAGYDENKSAIPTEIGKVIAQRYHEIYIDEYQDSNYLQEDILTSVSTCYKGINNMFMVGDVKQSIYRFRNARPDLFLKKYERYSDEGPEIKIELKNNFRSRAVVLNAANYISFQLMGRDLGGIEYDDSVALVPSRNFPVPSEEIEEKISLSTEIIIVNKDSETSKENENLSDDEKNMEKIELEALTIAKRIRELTETNPMQVYDDELSEYRNAQYRDIVILSRNIKGVGNIIYDVLTSQGIPVYLEESGRYFEAVEIRVIMSLLSVVDNCYQDISLAAVLLSPMGKLDENELAKICDFSLKNDDKKITLYEKCELYIQSVEDEITVKLRKIFDIILELKELNHNVSISKLIWHALELTGYYTYASAMPMGNNRRANINMLLEKAEQFEGGSYKGLFNFLRYVEKLKVNDVDFGEANTINDDANVVRIISMHKSKGLEYPIVFAGGLGKQFNTSDNKSKVIVHGDYYLSSKLMYKDARYEKDSNIRKAVCFLQQKEAIAEELRILYVAMTRAKEKLILTGCVLNLESIKAKYQYVTLRDDYLLPYKVRSGSKCFMEMIIACMARYDVLKKKIPGLNINVKEYDMSDAIKLGVDNAVKIKYGVMDLIEKINSTTIRNNPYKDSFSYKYKYEEYVDIKSKISVSEIKKQALYDGQEYDVVNIPEIVYYDENTMSGAQKGTLVHKFMELLGFDIKTGMSDNEYLELVKSFKKKLIDEKIFSEEEGYAINTKKIAGMLKSDLGQRMIAAANDKKLYKEQQFSLGINASKHFSLEVATDDIIILQGIIDSFFYEGEEIVIMDYKTDKADEDELIKRYKTQLLCYSDAVERMTGRKVKEMIIYSFYLDKQIKLPAI